jgi:hypothetical protein
MGLHLLIGEYVAHLDEDEAQAAAQNYIDEPEAADFTYVSRPQQPDYRKCVAMLRVAKRGRTQMRIKAELISLFVFLGLGGLHTVCRKAQVFGSFHRILGKAVESSRKSASHVVIGVRDPEFGGCETGRMAFG